MKGFKQEVEQKDKVEEGSSLCFLVGRSGARARTARMRGQRRSRMVVEKQ